MDWNLLFLLLSVLAIMAAPRIALSQCSSPSEQEVKQGLTTTLEAFLPEGNLADTMIIHNFNIVCYAVTGLDSYSSVSVVVNFTQILSGTATSDIYQFQMNCDSELGWVDNGEGYLPVSDSYLNLEPRRDCILCSYFQNDDAVRLCKACAAECANTGAGSCLDTTNDCCPYFDPFSGNCVDDCTAVNTHFSPNPTSFICECALECPIGTNVDSSCSNCIPTHICLTNNPCKNGATCVIGPGDDYSCSCLELYIGKNCDECSLGCANGKPNDNCSACNCNYGFFSQGLSCEEVKLCDPNPCLNGGTCMERPGLEYSCLCQANFIGFNCSSCQDGYGFFDGYCTVCRDEYCENCLNNATNCASCIHGYTFDRSQQCALDGFPTERLIWIIIGSVLGILLLATILFLALFGLYRFFVKGKSKQTLKNNFEKAGSAVTVNPLYISEDELLKSKI